MVAEATGVFFFCYCGTGSNLAYNIGVIGSKANLGSLSQVGVAYAIGIVLAISVCGSTSGGHFSPSVTLALVLFRGFPPMKALRYIIAQILGGYIAFLFIYVQYHDLIKTVEAALTAEGVFDSVNFSPQGMAGAFALYVSEGSNLHRVLLNEFVSDFILGVVIWACLDPTNFFLPPTIGLFVIASAYAAIIWGFAPVGLAANAARDIGGRLAGITIWGLKASGGNYAALAALTNIPATLIAVLFYEFFFTDSSRVVVPGHREFMEGHQAHMEHSELRHATNRLDNAEFDSGSEEKGHAQS
jgi:glycerol uptake facilitator-like aquaporin